MFLIQSLQSGLESRHRVNLKAGCVLQTSGSFVTNLDALGPTLDQLKSLDVGTGTYFVKSSLNDYNWNLGSKPLEYSMNVWPSD